jgi:hypothetical protein
MNTQSAPRLLRPGGWRALVQLVPLTLCMVALNGCDQPQDVSLLDLQGQVIHPLARADANTKAVVFMFLGIDCPISNRYAPEIARLDKTYSPAGIRFWLIYPGPDITGAAAEQQCHAYALTSPVGRDPNLKLAKRSGVKVTPEAAVYRPDGRLIYSGRIDDRFVDYGVKRPEPTCHDLEQVLQAVLKGEPLSFRRQAAVGCPVN